MTLQLLCHNALSDFDYDFDFKEKFITLEWANVQKQTNGSDCGLYCHCRLAAKEGKKMVMCDGCHEWYHEQCKVVPVAAWTNPDSKWHCGFCKCVV